MLNTEKTRKISLHLEIEHASPKEEEHKLENLLHLAIHTALETEIIRQTNPQKIRSLSFWTEQPPQNTNPKKARQNPAQE